MTVKQDATEGTVKVGPHGRPWIPSLAVGVLGTALSAYAVARGRPGLAAFGLFASAANVVIALLLRAWGVYLTSESAKLRRMFRRSSVPWHEVQAVVGDKEAKGTTVVQFILKDGERVTLPSPRSRWGRGDIEFEQDFDCIEQWWIAHRGESWHPVLSEEHGRPAQG
jgi:hypothetical protein